MEISAFIQGGLGNQLFILAACDAFAKQTGRNLALYKRRIFINPHSEHKYFETIFKNWSHLFTEEHETQIITEPTELTYIDWPYFINQNISKNILLFGYFQNWKYIESIKQSFINKLSFNDSIKYRYPWINEYFFIHVRGGDFIGDKLHHVDLNNYYKKCLQMINNEKIVLFTNDSLYAKEVLEGYSYILIEGDEEDSLYLMSQCKGGICANSTFSWWGAYLNSDRKLFLPSKWFNDETYVVDGYFFPGATVVDVDS